MKRNASLLLAALVLPAAPAFAQNLLVDFGRPGSPVEAGWLAYTAAHEVPADFTTQTFPAFGTTVDLTPTWADDPGGSATAKQMILRTEATPSPDLYQDWIGTDTRNNAAANPLTLTISGLPSGSYSLRSHHHDPQNQTGLIDITINDGAGSTTEFNFDQSAGGGAGAVPAIFEGTVQSNGIDEITIVYSVVEVNGTSTNAFVVLNGIELSAAVDPDSDGDGLEDLWEDLHFGDNSGTVEPSDLTPQDGAGDPDADGATNEQEETAGSDPNNGDSDGDGLSDGDEINVHGSDPLSSDGDGDGILDAEEIVPGADGFITDPASADSDGDHQSDPVEIANGTDPSDGTNFTRVAELAVDFNSNQDDGGSSADDPNPAKGTPNHNQFGYQSYHANHEVAAEFAPATYPAFGTIITLTPEFPDTVDPRVQQSIDRTNQDAAGNVLGGFDANWGGQKINLLTDWIGVDTRTGNGGNGAYDGISGTPTRMTMRLAGLPAGSYTWQSFHHDTEHMNPNYIMEVSTDGGLTFFQIGGVRRVTDSTTGGNPPAPQEYDGVTDPVSGDPADLPSTVNTCFISNGTDDVLFKYTPLYLESPLPVDAPVHVSFFVMNGFEIDEFPNDSDDDCFDDTDEIAVFGNLSQGPNDDTDGDGLDNITEVIRGTDPTNPDSDGDGLEDGEELNVHSSNPLASDSDGDGLSDGDEVNVHGTDPVLVDTDGDTLEDGFEVTNNPPFNPTVDNSFDDFDSDGLDTLTEGQAGTDPLNPDTDNDGISDGDEWLITFTDPLLADTDGDGLDDGEEDLNADGFLDPDETDPFDPDTDFDGASDGFEVANNPPYDPRVDNSADDFDNDGLTTFDEGTAGTDLTNPDTDGDGINDGDEWFTTFTNPTLADSDLDGLLDGEEDKNANGFIDPGETSPTLSDTDLDGYNDNRELMTGTDPDDPASYPLPLAGGLYVDFNSNQDNGGDSTTDPDPTLSVANHNQLGYQSYHANHEVIAEFVTANYAAFGTTVSFTPSWPDTTDNRVQQSIDRGAGNDANWNGDLLNLLTDWIGADTRTGNGGLGNFDGVLGTPTPMHFTLGGLPAGEYRWRSYHHDTEHMNATMTMEVSTDGGVTFGPAITTTITDSTPAGNPASVMTYDGPVNPGSFDPADLPSTINTSFTANGSDDVVVRFVPLSEIAVHRQFSVVNGFELTVDAGPVGEVVITDVSFSGGEVEVTGEGFAAGSQYVLRRSVDGQNWTDVNAPFIAAGSSHTEPDGAAPAGTALYQFWTP